MRHGKKHNHLGRTTAHRVALLRNLAIALITHKRIKTTLAKAKALRAFIEPIVTKARNNTTHSRRVVFSYLQDKDAIQELFGPVVVKIGDRPGGYTRVLHTGFRKGDGAEMALIEFVDFNEIYVAGKEEAQKETGRKRSRRGRGGSGAGKSEAKAAAPVTIETIVADEVEEAVEIVEEVAERIVEDVVETVEEAAEEAAADEAAEAADETKEEEQK
ncbi:MAG: 50S ribosomal protein L17 [Saprospiraceae bacterium]|nr:50S ribosomal protein L17 [Saprospiraceae bacterium]